MKTGYVFTIHQVDDAGDPVVYEECTTHQERVFRAMKHALKIDAVFNCYSVPIEDAEHEFIRQHEKDMFRRLVHWGWQLPPKFQLKQGCA